MAHYNKSAWFTYPHNAHLEQVLRFPPGTVLYLYQTYLVEAAQRLLDEYEMDQDDYDDQDDQDLDGMLNQFPSPPGRAGGGNRKGGLKRSGAIGGQNRSGPGAGSGSGSGQGSRAQGGLRRSGAVRVSKSRQSVPAARERSGSVSSRTRSSYRR